MLRERTFRSAVLLRVFAVSSFFFLNACGSGSDARLSTVSADGAIRSGQPIQLGSADLLIGRVGAMTWLDDERLAVVDESSQEILVFAVDGSLQERVGRVGDGPGEFRRISRVGVQNGDLMVFESTPGPSRAHRRTASGNWTHQDLRDSQGRLRALGVLNDSTLLVTRDGFIPVTPPLPGEMRRDTVVFGMQHSTSGLSWLPAAPGMTWLGYTSEIEGGRVLMSSQPFGPFNVTSAAVGEAWLCDSGTGECSVFSAGGQLLGSVRIRAERIPLTSSLLQSLLELASADAANSFVEERVRAQYDRSLVPTHLPALDALFPDPYSGVWALVRTGDGMARSLRYLSSSGERDEYLPLPENFGPRVVGAVGVAGVVTEDDGSEHITLLPWVRPISPQ